MTKITLTRKTTLKQKGRIETPPFFDARKLSEHHIHTLNTKLAQLFTDKDNQTKGNQEDETPIQARD